MKAQIVAGIRRGAVLAAVLVMALLMVSVSKAQSSKGILAGTVRDSSGAVVPAAKITVINEETAETRDTASDGEGTYRIEAISPGSYAVHATAAGFESFSAKGVQVNPSVVTTYEPVLTVGSAATTVEVQASTNAINTENGALSGTINTAELRDLPIFSLNPIELATTVPGVQIVNQSQFSNGVNIEVNGTRPRANNFLIDGADINDTTINGQAVQPNIPDMYASETILTNSYTAEYGRGGGGIVNLITQGGTNKFHGTVWDLYSGSGLNALDGVSRQTAGSSKARYDQHQYGFTAGGPIIHDKLFAFGALQLSRFYGKEQSTRVALPDAAGYATLKSINTPNSLTLQQLFLNGSYLSTFAGPSAPCDATGTDPNNLCVAVQAVNPADCPGGTPCSISFDYYTRPNPSELSPDTQWTYRIDFQPRQADVFYMRYLHDRSSLTPDFFNNGTQLPGLDTNQGGPSELGSGAWTHIFSPTLVNEFRASETRISFIFGLTPQAQANPLSQIPTTTISGISNLPPLGAVSGDPQGRNLDLYQF
ncbi:MAG TPA: TonB-dependent receptor, partial [Acidisarcina sp.]